MTAFNLTQAQIDALPVTFRGESRGERATFTLGGLRPFGRLPCSFEVCLGDFRIEYEQGYQHEGEGWSEVTVTLSHGRTSRSVYFRGADRADFLAAVRSVVQGRTLDEIHAAW